MSCCRGLDSSLTSKFRKGKIHIFENTRSWIESCRNLQQPFSNTRVGFDCIVPITHEHLSSVLSSEPRDSFQWTSKTTVTKDKKHFHTVWRIMWVKFFLPVCIFDMITVLEISRNYTYYVAHQLNIKFSSLPKRLGNRNVAGSQQLYMNVFRVSFSFDVKHLRACKCCKYDLKNMETIYICLSKSEPAFFSCVVDKHQRKLMLRHQNAEKRFPV